MVVQFWSTTILPVTNSKFYKSIGNDYIYLIEDLNEVFKFDLEDYSGRPKLHNHIRPLFQYNLG